MQSKEDFTVGLIAVFKIKLVIVIQLTTILISQYANEIIGAISLTGSACYIWLKVYREIKEYKQQKENNNVHR